MFYTLTFHIFFVLLDYTKSSYYDIRKNIITCNKKNVCLLNIVCTGSFTVTKNLHFTDLIIACHRSIIVIYFSPMEVLQCYLQPTVGYNNIIYKHDYKQFYFRY